MKFELVKPERKIDCIWGIDAILKKANENVRPPEFMIRFYNFVGRIPLKIGMIFFLLTSIDTVRVSTRAIRTHTDAAIQVIYAYKFRPWRLIWALGDHLWLSSYNCRSVRSRGLFTREAVKLLTRDLVESKKGMVEAVSLGSGSAAQMLQGIAGNGFNGDKIHLVLVDNDRKALERGRKNARRLMIEDVIDSKETTIGRFLKTVESGTIDLIEMIGLADYFDEKRFSRYLREISEALSPEGFFIGANISSDEEADYAHKVACWPKMFYREKEKIVHDLRAAGFSRIWAGDCGLYTVWVAQK